MTKRTKNTTCSDFTRDKLPNERCATADDQESARKKSVQIFVRGTDSNTRVVSCDDGALKEQVAAVQGLKVSEIRLFLNGSAFTEDILWNGIQETTEFSRNLLEGEVLHASLAHAGEVKGQTPKVDKQKKKGRSKRIQPNQLHKKKNYFSAKILTGNEVQGIRNKVSLHRLNYLYQLQDLIALVSPVLNLAYGKQLATIKNKSLTMFSPQLRRTICKGCSSRLLPGNTATVKWKTSKGTPRFNRVTCQICYRTQIYPWNPAKKNRIEETIELIKKDKFKKEAEDVPQSKEKTNVNQLK